MTAPSNANTSGLTPTDALRLVPVPYVVLSEAAGLLDCEGYGPLALTLNNLLSAAPASPLPGGGPTYQLCARKIEGWICQGCGSHFYENDAGALVLNAIPAAPTGDAG